jgi:MEMO1 family protein
MAATTIRHPAVAGQFYPRDPDRLVADIKTYASPKTSPIAAIGCIVPHAGYMYSGHVAGAVFARLKLPARFVILCPNHTGMGTPLSVVSEGQWETPLGSVSIDSRLATGLKSNFSFLSEDTHAHRSEHAIEVQLPFLQARLGKFSFVPIAVGTGRFEALEMLGNAMAEVIAVQPEPVLMIASSDMNHYESDGITRQKDALAIQRILALDPRGLFDVVNQQKISMCGYGPAVSMLTAARRLGATSAELIKYATSADVSGDREMVVGYAGVAVTETPRGKSQPEAPRSDETERTPSEARDRSSGE